MSTNARGGEFVVPDGRSMLAAGDSLLVLADAEAARGLERIVGARVDSGQASTP